MGKRIENSLRVAGLAVGCLMLSQAQVLAAEFTLKVADTFPSGHYIMKNMTEVWMNAVKEKTGGRVDFQYFPGGQLGKLSEMLDMVQNGVADVAYVPPSSYAERIPLTGVCELPGLFSNTHQGSVAFANLLNDYLAEKEFTQFNVLPIMATVIPPYQVGANREPIVTEDGFKGVRIRTPGGVLELVGAAVGGLAVPMSGPATYTALQRGTVDATLQSFLSMRSYKLYEVFKSVSSNANFGTFGIIYVINKDALAKLPADIQKILIDTGKSVAEDFSKWMDVNEGKAKDEFKAKGLEIYEIPKDVWAAWKVKLATVGDQWAKRADERGLPGTETVTKWREAVEKAGKM